MYIGLVRHFKVNCDIQFFMNSADFENWVVEYDISDVIKNDVKVDHISWNRCFSSDLPRAIRTSEAIYKGEIVTTALLREVPLCPIFKTKVKLPYFFWCISARVAWHFQHKSQFEIKKDTLERVDSFISSLDQESDDNIVIVCHGFYMKVLLKALKKNGFNGKHISSPKNGKLYVYKK